MGSVLRTARVRRGPASAVAVVLCALAASPANAARITASLDRGEVSLEDELLLTVRIDGSQSARPKAPDLSDFEVESRGQSSQFQLVNGAMSASVQHSFALVPKRTGTLTVGAFTVLLDGQTYSTKPLTVRVTGAPQRPASKELLFATASASTPEPFVGQQTVYTLRLYARADATCSAPELPELAALSPQVLGEQRSYDTTMDGQRYRVLEVRRALFPARAGRVELGAAGFTCDVAMESQRRGLDPFDNFVFGGRTQRKRPKSNPVTLEVRPLPPAPAGFSGLVGRVDLAAQASRTELQRNTSLTLSVVLTTNANPQALVVPEIVAPPGFKVYANDPSTSSDGTGVELVTRRALEQALVPTQVGRATLDGISLVYFDPEQARFQTASAPPLVIEVRESSDSEVSSPAVAGFTKQDVRVYSDGLLPIHRDLDALSTSTATPGVGGTSLVLALPPALFLALVGWRRRLDHDARHPHLRRRRVARARALAALARLAPESDGAAQLAAQASRILRELVGDLLDVRGSALTEGETLARLEGSLPPALAAEVRRALTRCEAMRYGGQTTEERARELLADVRALIVRLDEALR